MEIIRWNRVIPHFWGQIPKLHSGIWGEDVSLEQGRLCLIEAVSGSGKTSLCTFIGGFRSDYSGEILYKGRDIRTFRIQDWTEIRQRHLSVLYQDLRLFPEMTTLENVQMKNQLTHYASQSQIMMWLEQLGVAAYENEPVGRMSYGQQQRVALVRALCQPFELLLADEPISHLDDMNADVMASLLSDELRQRGAGALVTSIGKRLPLNFDIIYKL